MTDSDLRTRLLTRIKEEGFGTIEEFIDAILSIIEQERAEANKQLETIPHGPHVDGGWNRYDTDDELVLHIWADGKSYDIRCEKWPT